MSDEELRREAVRRRLAGESPEQIASALGRTDRWVRKWVARHSEDGQDDEWAQERSRAPHSSPTRTPDELRDQILAARTRLVANPPAQYGSVGEWPSKGVPYPMPVGVEPGTTHQVDLIPLREPWRNGVVEHFNDVWDKSFFRTEVFGGLDHLRAENRAFIASHNTHHRYAAHGGASPGDIMAGRLRNPLSASYQPPTRLPAQGRIEVVRYVCSNRRVELFGKRITVAEDQYVTAIIKLRTRKVVVVTLDGGGHPPR